MTALFLKKREIKRAVKGDGVLCPRDIDKGELILTEKALGCGPNHTLEAWHCLDCLKPMEQLNRYHIPIDKGELILLEKALGCGPNHTLEAWHCLDCLKPMEQLNRYYSIYH
jgi:hypothetical protein